MKALKDRVNNLIFSFTYTFDPGKHVKQVLHLDYEDKVYRQNDLVNLIRDAITHFALTPEEFSDFVKDGDIGEMQRTAWSRISKAKALKKGDYGELLLFLILLIIHKAPKFVTKVRLRSSVKDQIKGFDCAHFTVEKGEPVLWLGEAKFHKTFSGALTGAIASIKEHFSSEYLKDEISILQSNIEANKDYDVDGLKTALRGKSLDKLKFRVPILLTYDSAKIKENNDTGKKFRSDIEAELSKHNSTIESKSIKKGKNVELLFIIFPLHTVEEIKNNLDEIEKLSR